MLNAAFGSDKPDLRKIEVVKNKAIQSQIDPAIKANQNTFDLSEANIANFLSRFGANQGAYDTATGQSLQTISDIYGGAGSGGLDDDLAQLRANSMRAREDATQRALNMIEGRDRAYAAQMGLPGRSSYRDLMGARLSRDAMIDAALADAGQARADYGYSLAQKLGNLGTTQQLLAAQESRELQPLAAVAGARGIPLQNLGQLTNLDQANKFYGTYRKRGAMERMANAEQVGMDQLGQLVDMAGSVAGIAGAFCWVARECFGESDIRWKLFRLWLSIRAPFWLYCAYRTHGEKFAAWLSKHPILKPVIRRWMNGRISNLMAEFA